MTENKPNMATRCAARYNVSEAMRSATKRTPIANAVSETGWGVEDSEFWSAGLLERVPPVKLNGPIPTPPRRPPRPIEVPPRTHREPPPILNLMINSLKRKVSTCINRIA